MWYFDVVIWTWSFWHCLKTRTTNSLSAENQYTCSIYYLLIIKSTFCCQNGRLDITSFYLISDLLRSITSHIKCKSILKSAQPTMTKDFIIIDLWIFYIQQDNKKQESIIKYLNTKYQMWSFKFFNNSYLDFMEKIIWYSKI